jgi:hypothetical protein
VREEQKVSKRSDIRDTLAVRESNIKEERQFRSDLREGKTKGGVGAYFGSLYRESRQKSKVRGLEEMLDPNLKKTRKIDREIKAMDRRQKFGKAFDKVTDGFDQVGAAYDDIGKGFNSSTKKSKGGGGGFGLSESDIMDLAGLRGIGFGGSMGGGGKQKKRSGSSSKQVPIYRGTKIVGYRQTGGSSGRKKASKAKKEPQDWGDLV